MSPLVAENQLVGTRQGLHGDRDDNTVIYLGDSRGGPGYLLRSLFFRVGTDRAAQGDLAALHFDGDPFGIRLRIAHQRLLDLRLQIVGRRLRFDREEIGDSSDARDAFYSTFGISLLEVIVDFTLERYPTMIDRHINFVGWNTGIPLEGVEYGFGKVGVGAFGRAGQTHLDIVDDRLDARNAVRIFLGRNLFQVRIDPTRQSNDSIFDRHPDFIGPDAYIPLQFFQHIALNIFI